MKNTKYYLFSLVFALWASALSAQTHWSVNVGRYGEHMTVYYSLLLEGASANLSDYEVAAFIGDECRGVGQVVTMGGNSVGMLMIYGDAADAGKKISFKHYHAGEEKNIYGTDITFAVDGLKGMPSSPVAFDLSNFVLPGDADGDGVVDLTDAVAIFQFYMMGDYPNFNEDAADFDGDGTLDLTDAVLVFDYYMNQ